MLVHFSYIGKSFKTSTQSVMLFYNSLFNSILTENNLILDKGYKYSRLQRLVWSEASVQDLINARRNSIKPKIKTEIKYSYHLPYIFNSLDEFNYNILKDYILKLMNIIIDQELYSITLCSHLNIDIEKDIYFWSKLFKECRDNCKISLPIYMGFENCDKNLNLEGTYKVAKYFNIPVIYDNMHHLINPSYVDLEEIIEYSCKMFYLNNRKPYTHYSTPAFNIHKHGDNINDDIFDILTIYKKYTKELIIIPELNGFENAIKTFKERTEGTIKWLTDYCFEF